MQAWSGITQAPNKPAPLISQMRRNKFTSSLKLAHLTRHQLKHEAYRDHLGMQAYDLSRPEQHAEDFSKGEARQPELHRCDTASSHKLPKTCALDRASSTYSAHVIISQVAPLHSVASMQKFISANAAKTRTRASNQDIG
jgi:hypothetical protein